MLRRRFLQHLVGAALATPQARSLSTTRPRSRSGGRSSRRPTLSRS